MAKNGNQFGPSPSKKPMNKPPSPAPSLSRSSAEAKILATVPSVDPSSRSVEDLLHELQVHQIELEMQNEALRQTQIALEASRDAYINLFEFAPVGYLILSREGLIQQINLTGASLLGADRKQLIQRRFDALLAPEDQVRWARQFMRALQCDDRLSGFELPLRRDNHPNCLVRLDCMRMVTDGNPPEVRITLTNITEQKLAEAALKENQQRLQNADLAKDRFLAMMSHELRTPLSGVLGLMRLMANTELTTQQRQWLDAMRYESQAQLIQLSDILDMAQIDSGHFKIEPEACDLYALIEITVSLFIDLIEGKGLTFQIHLAPNLPAIVWIDPHRVRQILGNLINNAIRFTDQGHIALSVEVMDNRLCFAVSDTGIGIKEGLGEQIFEPFFQENTESNRRHGGTGLGLAICKRLVADMSGQIRYQSQSGQGCCFRFELPLIEVREPPPAPREAQLLSKRLRILLVEDNLLNRIATAGLLASLGHGVVVAKNGLHALETCTQQGFDLILADLHMPDMDGFEFATTLRQRPEGQGLLLFSLTADLSAETHRRALALFDGVLTKPFNEQDLYRMLKARMPGFDLPPPSSPPSAISPAIDGMNHGQLAKVLAAMASEKRSDWLLLTQKTLETHFSNIRRSVMASDWPVLAREAHRMVSTTGIAGLVDLEDRARLLVDAAHQNGQNAVSLLAEFEAVMPRTLRQLDEVGRLLIRTHDHGVTSDSSGSTRR
ncbi:putative histidine kinase [Gammaproteobacteria bacterium]